MNELIKIEDAIKEDSSINMGITLRNSKGDTFELMNDMSVRERFDDLYYSFLYRKKQSLASHWVRWLNDRTEELKRICDALYSDYNPIWNIDGNETTTSIFGEDINSVVEDERINVDVFGEITGTNTYGKRITSNVYGEETNTNVYGEEKNTNVYGETKNTNLYGDKETETSYGEEKNTISHGAKKDTKNTSSFTDETKRRDYAMNYGEDTLVESTQNIGGDRTEQNQSEAYTDIDTKEARIDSVVDKTHTDTITISSHTDTITNGSHTDTITNSGHNDTITEETHTDSIKNDEHTDRHTIGQGSTTSTRSERTDTIELVRKGNIGVTSTQSLISQELSLRMKPYCYELIDNFAHEFFI